jgi:hypothetical protein
MLIAFHPPKLRVLIRIKAHAIHPQFIGFLFHMVDLMNFMLWNVDYPIKKLLMVISTAMMLPRGGADGIQRLKRAIRSWYGLPPAPKSPRQLKISAREVQREFDDLCAHYPALIPQPSPHQIPHFTLVTRYNPVPAIKRPTSSQSLANSNAAQQQGADGGGQNSSSGSEMPPSDGSSSISKTIILNPPPAVYEAMRIHRSALYIPVSSVQLAQEHKYYLDPASCLPPTHLPEHIGGAEMNGDMIKQVERFDALFVSYGNSVFNYFDTHF